MGTEPLAGRGEPQLALSKIETPKDQAGARLSRRVSGITRADAEAARVGVI